MQHNGAFTCSLNQSEKKNVMNTEAVLFLFIFQVFLK